jgi:hypothetical protein
MAQFMEGDRSAPPFWFSDRLSADTVIYAALLAVVAAAIVGVVPALKATGPRLQARLKTAGAGGPGLKFGGVWTAVVIGQIAMTVIFLMGVVSAGWNARVSPYAAGNFAFRAQEYVTVDLVRDREAAPASYTRAYLELERRLEGNPAVASVTHTTRMPGGGSEFILDRESLPSSGLPDPLWVRSAFVGADFFATFDAPIVSGRGFTLADVERARPVVVVDETFVRTVAGGRDPVGMRVRQRAQGTQTTPWLEVVGVVRDLGIRPQKTSEDAMLYRPGTPGETGGGVYVVVRARGDAAGLLALVRRTAAEVDPALRLDDLMPLPEFNRVNTIAAEFMMRGLSVVAAVALLLSSAGIYALMSFTLSRRTREIGIRAALGAAPRSIVAAIFSRAFAQVGLGVVAGSVPGYLLVAMGAPEVARGGGPLVGVVATLAVAGFVTVIAGAACALPARRALRIHPTDALRAD